MTTTAAVGFGDEIAEGVVGEPDGMAGWVGGLRMLLVKC